MKKSTYREEIRAIPQQLDLEVVKVKVGQDENEWELKCDGTVIINKTRHLLKVILYRKG